MRSGNAARLALLAGALLGGAAAQAAAPERPAAPKAGYALFDDDKARFFCQLPEGWARQAFPAKGNARRGRLELKAGPKDGRSTLTVKLYSGNDKVWKSPDRFIADVAGPAPARPVKIGVASAAGRYFELRTRKGGREAYAVLPLKRKPRFCVFHFAGDAQAFARDLEHFRHALATFVLKPKGP